MMLIKETKIIVDAESIQHKKICDVEQTDDLPQYVMRLPYNVIHNGVFDWRTHCLADTLSIEKIVPIEKSLGINEDSGLRRLWFMGGYWGKLKQTIECLNGTAFAGSLIAFRHQGSSSESKSIWVRHVDRQYNRF